MLPPISPHNPNRPCHQLKTVQPAPAPGPADVSYRHHPWGGTAPGVGETHSIPADQHMKTAQPAVPPGNIYNPEPAPRPVCPNRSPRINIGLHACASGATRTTGGTTSTCHTTPTSGTTSTCHVAPTSCATATCGATTAIC